MPIFVYKCPSCKIERSFMGAYEKVRSKEDSYICSDKGCAKLLVRKVCATSFSLRGKSWYKDGYK